MARSGRGAWVVAASAPMALAALVAAHCTSSSGDPSATGGAGTGDSGGGVSGETGNGGAQSGGTTSDGAPNESSAPPDAGLPCGAGIWTPVLGADAEACGLMQADTSHWCYPLPSWSSCGPGCQRAPIQAVPWDTGVNEVVGEYLDGRLLVRLRGGWKTPPTALTWQVDIKANQLLAAVAAPNPPPGLCQPALTLAHSPRVWPFLVSSDKLLAAHGADPSGKLTWQAHPLGFPMKEAIFDAYLESGFWGVSFYNGSIGVVASLDASDWTFIEPSAALPTYEAAARADLVIYPRWNGTSGRWVLKGWVKGAAAPVTLYTGKDNAWKVALSDDTMLWVGVDGPNYTSGEYTSATLYWSPIAKQAADLQVTTLSSLPLDLSFKRLDGAGDFAGFSGCNSQAGVCRTVVVRRSTAQVFTIKTPAGKYWELVALAPDEVLLEEHEYPNPEAGVLAEEATALVRIATDSLDQWNEPLPSP